MVLSGSTYYMFSILDSVGVYYSTASAPLGPWSSLTLLTTPPTPPIGGLSNFVSDVEVDYEGAQWVMRVSTYNNGGLEAQQIWRYTSPTLASGGTWTSDPGNPVKVMANTNLNGFNRIGPPTTISGSYVSAIDCYTYCNGNSGKLWEITKQ